MLDERSFLKKAPSKGELFCCRFMCRMLFLDDTGVFFVGVFRIRFNSQTMLDK